MKDTEFKYINRKKVLIKSEPCIPLRPSLVVAASIMGRYFFGSMLILGLGAFYIPEGEYGQYIVSYDYAIHSVAGWFLLCISAAVGYLSIKGLVRKDTGGGKRRPVLFTRKWLADEKNIRRITLLCCAAGLVQLLFIVVAIATGSEDRGSTYDYWAMQDWKPTSIFISIERLFGIFYTLAPIVVFRNKWRGRLVVLCIYSSLTLANFSLSGRGVFLYPILYTLVGMAAVVERKILMKWVVLFAIMVAVMVPAMAAIRDLPSYGSYGSTNMLGRALLYIQPASYGDNLRRRIFALGREVYACSDGFIYRDAGARRYGFGDMSIGEIGRLALPRVIGGHEEKLDGSRIAQQYMGVEKGTWFPCITLQGDLYRRGGTIAIAAGGFVYGTMLYLADRCWLAVSRGNKMFSIVLTLLPITMLKSAPTGTVREVVSFFVYEIMKYVAIAWFLTMLESGITRINRMRRA